MNFYCKAEKRKKNLPEGGEKKLNYYNGFLSHSLRPPFLFFFLKAVLTQTKTASQPDSDQRFFFSKGSDPIQQYSVGKNTMKVLEKRKEEKKAI